MEDSSTDSDLQREESHSSYISMRDVDPSPVDETPQEFADESYFPGKDKDNSPSHPGRSTTLGLGNHGPVYYRMYLPYS